MIEEISSSLEETVVITPSGDKHWSANVKLVKSAHVEKVNALDERPHEKGDFASSLGHRLEKLTKIQRIIRNVDKKNQVLVEDKTVLRTFTVPVIVLCGENVSASDWTDSRHIEAGYKILTLLKKEVFHTDNMADVLLQGNVLKWCLQELHPKLDKDSWRLYPAACRCFSWLLHQITAPNLSNLLNEFLPFVLRFIDDWDIKNKAFGVQCLNHIVDNTTKSELTRFGRDGLVRDALFKMISYREEDLIPTLFKCVYAFLNKIPGPKDSLEKYAKLDQWDTLAKSLLHSMEAESKADLRRLYVQQLRPLLIGLGLGTVRWLSTGKF